MSSTVVLSEQKSLLWRIPNFVEVLNSKELLNKQYHEFETDIKLDGISPLTWTCLLRLPFRIDEENRTICVKTLRVHFIWKYIPSELSNYQAKFQCQLGNKEDGRYFMDDEFIVNVDNSMDQQRASRSQYDISQRNMSSYLTADGALEIRITVTVYHPPGEQGALAALESSYETGFTENLRAQLVSLGENPLNISSTATKLVSKDGKQFSADRVILAARSPVFRAMFQSGMREDKNGIVEVKEIDSKPLEVLLHFIQTAKLRLNWKCEGVIEGLVYGAHKYMLEDLQEFLDNVVGLVCTKENCGKLMVLAKMFEMKKAQKQLLDYLGKNLVNSLDEFLKFVEEIAVLANLMNPLNTDEEEQEQLPRPKKQKAEETD